MFLYAHTPRRTHKPTPLSAIGKPFYVPPSPYLDTACIRAAQRGTGREMVPVSAGAKPPAGADAACTRCEAIAAMCRVRTRARAPPCHNRRQVSPRSRLSGPPPDAVQRVPRPIVLHPTRSNPVKSQLLCCPGHAGASERSIIAAVLARHRLRRREGQLARNCAGLCCAVCGGRGSRVEAPPASHDLVTTPRCRHLRGRIRVCTPADALAVAVSAAWRAEARAAAAIVFALLRSPAPPPRRLDRGGRGWHGHIGVPAGCNAPSRRRPATPQEHEQQHAGRGAESRRHSVDLKRTAGKEPLFLGRALDHGPGAAAGVTMPDGGKADTSLHTFRIHTDAVSALHLVGDTLYSGSYDCSVAAINLVQGAAAHTFHGSQSMVHCVHEREGTVYIGNDGGDILLLDSKSGQMSGALRGHKRAVTCFCSEENILYSGSQDGIIRQWDTRTQKCLRKIKVHSGPVTCVQVVDGTMHSGSWDGSLYTFADGEGRRHWGADRNSPLQSLIPAAGLVYAAYRDGRARVWAPMTTDKVVTTFVGHDAGIPAILVDEQARMYLGSEDRTISVWDLKMQASFVDTEKRSCVYTGHTDGILSLAKGENLLYSGSFDHTIKIWDLKAVDRALFPEIEERSLPLHKLAQGGAGLGVHASRADPDWWKSSPPLGGPYFCIKLGLRLDHTKMLPTVAEVFPDSVAERSGLRAGDQLTKLNDFEVPTVAVLQECLMYLRPQEAVELAYEKLLPNDIGFESKVAKFEVQDPSCVADEPMESIVNAKQLVAGIYDVFDPGAPAMQQAPAFADLIATHSDLFRKMMLKYGDVTDSSIISTRSFWLLAHQCKLVTAKCSLAELDRLFILNRIRQLYPHPRVDEIMVLLSSNCVVPFLLAAGCRSVACACHKPARQMRV